MRERMMVSGRPIPEDALAMWTARLRPLIERHDASFFEATTAVAFADFAARGVEIAVVEVGLGGRLDATNVIHPLATAITSIGFDHMQYLGDTEAEIAGEKAGITKPGIPLVLGEMSAEAYDTIAGAAAAVGAPVERAADGPPYEGPLALQGAHQRANATVAQRLLDRLPPPWRVPADVVQAAFGRATVPGRFDRRGAYLFDVAHNPAGAVVLADEIRAHDLPRPVHAVVGVLGDKDRDGMLAALAPVVDAIWVTVPPGAPADRVGDVKTARSPNGVPVTIEPRLATALAAARAEAGTTLVTGSFHTVGAAMDRLPGFAPLG
jgi:dihydrofolate synthase/folylpolyglutamate synthase